MKTHFETETCSRCNGSGTYSFCQMYADKCFKCHGQKVVFTKRGAAAKSYLEKLCTIPANEVKIGDRVAGYGLTNGGNSYNFVGTVLEIKTRVGTKTTTKTLRDDKVLNVSYSVQYDNNEGFSVLGSSGSTVEYPSDPGYKTGQGTFVEQFNESLILLTSKYGETGMTAQTVRIYPKNQAELIQQAIEYQNTLTKQGLPKKKTASKRSTTSKDKEA